LARWIFLTLMPFGVPPIRRRPRQLVGASPTRTVPPSWPIRRLPNNALANTVSRPRTIAAAPTCTNGD
jgi:hypothetical protein